MKINRKLIIGIVLCFIGPVILQIIFFSSHIAQGRKIPHKAIPLEITAIAIVIAGAYVIYLGKKQQKEERENND